MNTAALVCLLGTLRVSEVCSLDGRIFGLLRKLVYISGSLFNGAFLRFLSGQTWPRFNLKKTQKQTPPSQLGVHFADFSSAVQEQVGVDSLQEMKKRQLREREEGLVF